MPNTDVFPSQGQCLTSSWTKICEYKDNQMADFLLFQLPNFYMYVLASKWGEKTLTQVLRRQILQCV